MHYASNVPMHTHLLSMTVKYSLEYVIKYKSTVQHEIENAVSVEGYVMFPHRTHLRTTTMVLGSRIVESF